MGQLCAACMLKAIRGVRIEVYANRRVVALCFGAVEGEEVGWR